MATITQRDRDGLPEWAVSTAKQIEEFGFKWIFDWEYPVPDPDTVKRVQIRDEAHVGQKPEVDLYAEAYKRGEKLPPGVSTRDGRIIDFNTRARALHKLGWPTCAMFVLQVDYETADAFTRQKIHLMGAAFNRGGPKDLTESELVDAIRMAAENPDDWSVDSVAAHLHTTRAFVQNVYTEVRAEKRAANLGVPIDKKVSKSVRRDLGKRISKLADEPYREIVRLINDVKLPTTDAAKLVKGVVDISTGDSDRLAFISGERKVREGDPTRQDRPLAVKALEYLGFFAKESHRVNDMVNVNPNTRDKSPELIDGVIEVLRDLAAAQRQSNEEGV